MNLSTVFSIANQTFWSFVKDKIFYSCLAFSVIFTSFALYLSTLTIVESTKVLLDFGLAAISINGIGLGIYVGLTVIGKEIEKRTIYSVLTKPVSRLEYLIGKIAGASIIICFVHLLNMVTLLLIVYLNEQLVVLPILLCNILLSFESILVMSIAMFFSITTSSTVLASTLTIAVFLIGRSNIALQKLAATASNEIRYLLKAFYVVFPALDRFNTRDLVAYYKPVASYVYWENFIYFVCYLILIVTIAHIAFRKKDLL